MTAWRLCLRPSLRSPAWLALPLVASLASAPGAAAQVTAEQALANARIGPAPRCGAARAEDEIVVCGSRAGERSRYRIPEGMLKPEPGARSGLIAGEAPRASAAANPTAPCGIFEGQRRCSKAEAALYGYGEGRDPLTVGGKVVDALTDPE